MTQPLARPSRRLQEDRCKVGFKVGDMAACCQLPERHSGWCFDDGVINGVSFQLTWHGGTSDEQSA